MQGLPKLRVATAKQLSGTVNPVTYDVVNYNHEMEYHNGVIIIMQPGYYTCTATTRGHSNGMINIYIMVENREQAYGRRFVDRTEL